MSDNFENRNDLTPETPAEPAAETEPKEEA